MPMELMIRPAEVTIPQAIDNFEELKAELQPKLQQYASLVVSEEGISAAKKDKAELNKLRTAVEDQRKAVKKQCLELQTTFETQCKELVGMIDEPIAAIDGQIRSFEEKKKQDKHDELAAYFADVNELPFVRLEDVLDPKWANVTAKLDKLKEGIAQKVGQLSRDFAEIKELYSDSALLTAILDRFAETKSKADALSYAAVLEKRDQLRLEEEAQKSELERIRQEKEAARKAETIVEKGYIPPADTVTKTTVQPNQLLGGCFAIKCTRQQLSALRQFMKEEGIQLIGTMPMQVYYDHISKEEF